MKRLNTITLAGFAVCGFLLGMKALDLVETGITLLLMVWGGYAYGAAAARAPLVLWAVLCTAAGLAFSLYELHRENQQYKQNSPYGRIDRTHEPDYRQSRKEEHSA